jgi:tryptophanyl-tRNA synthetase
MAFKVTPWEVEGDIDYEKLVKDFGIKPIARAPQAFRDDLFFRRGIVFAHRDFHHIAEAIEKKKPFVMMTGLMPSGNFHIGHMILAKQMIMYQELGAKLYVAVADVEAACARGQSLADSRRIALEQYIYNYIALGMKPKNCEIYFQSNRTADEKRANAYYRMQNLLSRHATFNEFRAIYGEISPGKMMAALLQAADMLSPMLPEFEGPVPVVVPVGIDQDPHLRLARDMAKRYKQHKLAPLCSTYHKFMPGLGGGKMSSSDPNSYIALTDTPKQAAKKINRYAFSGGQATVEEHRKLGGNPDVDVSFIYLSMFFEDDDSRLQQIHDDYKAGKILTGELKKMLIDKMTPFLEEHQKRLADAPELVNKFKIS